jgi:hypothetical protein
MHGRDEKCRVLVEKPEWKRPPFGRLRYGWEDNIKIYCKEIGWECGLNLFDSGLGPILSSGGHGNEPLGPIRGDKLCEC